MEAVRREFFGGSAVARDDLAAGLRRPEDELAAAVGGDWRPTDGSLADVVRQVRELGHGAMAFVLASHPARIGHGFLLRNEGGTVFRVETQARPGARVYEVGEQEPVRGADARAIVVDDKGRAVPPDTLPRVVNAADGILLPSTDRHYGASGRELEAGFGVHGHDGVRFSDGDVPLLRDRKTGVKLYTDTWRVWSANGRYYSTFAEAAKSGWRPEKVRAKVIEFVEPPWRVLRDERNRISQAEVSESVREMWRRLNGAVQLREGEAGPAYRGHSLRELFGDDLRYEFEIWDDGKSIADRVTIVRRPGSFDGANVQLTEGVPLGSVPTFLLSAVPLARSETTPDYLRCGLAFGTDIARMYLDKRLREDVAGFAIPAMQHVPEIAELRAAMLLLHTHTTAVARSYLHGGRTKNQALGSLRTSFAGIRASLSPDVRHFLERNAKEIRQELRDSLPDELDQEIDEYKRKQRAAGKDPRSFFEYPLEFQRRLDLRDYVDNMLLPPGKCVHINQDQAMNIRTHMDRLEDNGGRLTHRLVLLEMRDIGGKFQTLDQADAMATRFAGFANDAYSMADWRSRNFSPESREYVDTLYRAVRTVSESRDSAVSDARSFLNTAAWHPVPGICAPIMRGAATTNLLADAIVALGDVARGRSADDAIARLRQIRDNVVRYYNEHPGARGSADMATFERRARRAIDGLRETQVQASDRR
jgi:hypothetical protein